MNKKKSGIKLCNRLPSRPDHRRSASGHRRRHEGLAPDPNGNGEGAGPDNDAAEGDGGEGDGQPGLELVVEADLGHDGGEPGELGAGQDSATRLAARGCRTRLTSANMC